MKPFRFLMRIKWFIQRGRRGWADCDIWSFDSYLCSWMPDALKAIKEDKHGVPSEFFPNGVEEPTEEDWKVAIAEWHKALDVMIEGFLAHRRIVELDYPFPLKQKDPEIQHSDDSSISVLLSHEYDMSLATQFVERDTRYFNKGMKKFVEHFGSLWT